MDAQGHASHATWGLPNAESMAAQLASLSGGASTAGLVNSFNPPLRTPVSIRPIAAGDEALLRVFMLELQSLPEMVALLQAVQQALHQQRDVYAAVVLNHASDGQNHMAGLGVWCAAQRSLPAALGTAAALEALVYVHLVVAPAHRRCGIGEQLLRMLVLGAAARRVKRLSLTVTDQTPAGHRVISALGRAGWTPTAPVAARDGVTLQCEVPPLAECLRHLQRPRKRERMRLAGDLPRGWDHTRPDVSG